MSTRTPPTQADLDGTSQRGKDAYNERRAMLKARGINVPDLYDQDQLDDESDPSGAIRFWRQHANQTAANMAQERAWTREDEHANERRH